MKVVVPLAGRGSRFTQAGVMVPKPLIDVAGRPMIAWALDSLQGLSYTEIIFIVLEAHEREYGVVSMLQQLVGQAATVLLLNNVTEGQLCTVLAAKEHIDSGEDLLVASSDTLVLGQLGADIATRPASVRGIISVADMPGDRWSFARTDAGGNVVEVAEKVRISDYASTGQYYFASGREFITVAESMLAKKGKVQGEYYIMPMYQEYIHRGWDVRISQATEMWDMGTPDALRQFQLDYRPREARSAHHAQQ